MRLIIEGYSEDKPNLETSYFYERVFDARLKGERKYLQKQREYG